MSTDKPAVDKSERKPRPGGRKLRRLANQAASAAAQSAVLAADRLRRGQPPTAEMLATADPETFASEMLTLLRTAAVPTEQPGQPPAKAAAPSAPLPAHRPLEYTDEEGRLICEWVRDGNSLTRYCQAHSRAPSTVYRWLLQRADFREAYAQAHADRADTLVDEMVDIADRVPPTLEAVAKAKLQIETRRWCAERMRPTKWGLQQSVGPQQPITFNIGIAREPERITIEAGPAPTQDVRTLPHDEPDSSA